MPTLHDLDTAMLRPGRSVPAVSRLGGGAIAMGSPGRPLRVVGARHAVYQLRQGSGRSIALRCPLADPRSIDPAADERYRSLAFDPALEILRTTNGPIVGNVAFFTDGMAFTTADFRSAGHPLIAMDWVSGPTLAEAVDRSCRNHDRPYLEALADAWLGLLAELADVGFDHGDLVPNNVLIGDGGGLTLVDYDGSTWPGAPRPPADVAVAPAYAHPSGGAAPIGRRDRFPALVVYASLRILAVWPGLREDHGQAPGHQGGGLLFAARDLRDPDASALFRELRGLDDPIVPALAGLLRDACDGSAAATPTLSEVAASIDHDSPKGSDRRDAPPRWGDDGAGVRSRPPMPRTTEPTRDRSAGFERNRLDRPRQEDLQPGWVAGSATPDPSSPPSGFGSTVPTAGPEKGVGVREHRLTHLNGLLLAGDEDAAWRYWEESGLAADPDAVRELGPRMAEAQRRWQLRRAQDAADTGDGAALLRLWREGRFENHRPADPLRPAVEAARQRTATIERLVAAIDAGDREAVARLWTQTQGEGLPGPQALRAREMVSERVARAVGEARRRGDDEAIAGLVREARGAGLVLDAPTRRAARSANERTETRRVLRAAEEGDNREEMTSLALSGRLEELGPLPPATIAAARRALAWPILERALDADDDVAIVAAYDDRLFADDPTMRPEQRSRIDLARRRTAWLERVRAALRSRDGTALRSELGRTPPGVERRLSRVERGRIERLATRDEAVERLATALRDGPDTAIVEALNRVEAAGSPLPAALDWAAVRGVADRLTLAQAIRDAARSDPPDYALLARLLPTARAAMASAGVGLGADVDFARLESDVLRAAHLRRLREALARDDDAAIAAAARPDPFGALAGLSEAQRARVERALSSRAG